MQVRSSLLFGALAALATVSLAGSVDAQINYTGTTTGASTWNRPIADIPPTDTSGVGTAVPYSAYNFVVGSSGPYDIISNAVGGWDNFTALYAGGFNAADPLTHALAANDDLFGIGSSGFEGFSLSAGTSYTLVTTGFANTDFGDFSNSITKLVSTAPAPSAINLGTLGNGALHYNIGTIPADGVQWLSFTLGQDANDLTGNYVDIDTFDPATDGLDPDTEIGLYTADGFRIATNDDDFFNLSSQLTFGATSPVRPPVNDFGFLFDGFDGPLAAGTYYLAVGGYDTTFGATNFDVSALSDPGNYVLNIRSNVVPEPGSMALVVGTGMGLITLRRRRRTVRK